MKKGLLGSTALIGATALMAGAAGAAEAPTYKLTGNTNFQIYIPSGDVSDVLRDDASIFFGVDEAELQLNVSGTADNGLEYGFKIELNANTTDGFNADEARLQLSGGWGTIQMGDEDGAEDIMNYGGENLLGAAGSWDGDGDDVMLTLADAFFPTIAGDSSDHTKISYFSPRFSGFQVGGSWTPQPSMDGDDFKTDLGETYENHIGLGANYDNSFGDIRVRASAVYSMASSKIAVIEDISAWSVGGIVGFGPFSGAANYTDNGDSFGLDTDSYWNVAGSFETGPIYLSASYFSRTLEIGASEVNPTAIGLTADYSVAPGLAVYGEYTMYDFDGFDEGVFILGANVSF